MEYEEASQLYRGKCVMGRNEDSLLGEAINDNKDGREAGRGGKLLDKIHRDGIPGTRGNGKRFEESIGFMPTRLDSAADCARVAIVFYEGPHYQAIHNLDESIRRSCFDRNGPRAGDRA